MSEVVRDPYGAFECPRCGRPVIYKGRGRRPVWCSARSRVEASIERRGNRVVGIEPRVVTIASPKQSSLSGSRTSASESGRRSPKTPSPRWWLTIRCCWRGSSNAPRRALRAVRKPSAVRSPGGSPKPLATSLRTRPDSPLRTSSPRSIAAGSAAPSIGQRCSTSWLRNSPTAVLQSRPAHDRRALAPRR